MDWRIAVGGETYLKLKSPWKNENERKYEDDNLEGKKSKKGKWMKIAYDQFIDKKQTYLGNLSVFILLTNLPLQTFHPF